MVTSTGTQSDAVPAPKAQQVTSQADQASSQAPDAPAGEIYLQYPGGWGGDGNPRGISIDTVNFVSHNGKAEISVRYDTCRTCRANNPKQVYITLPLSKMDEMNALIDMREIKAALEKPCTLPQASNWYQTVSVRVVPKGDITAVPSSILLACQSPELDLVRGKLDKAMSLAKGWLLRHLAAQDPDQNLARDKAG